MKSLKIYTLLHIFFFTQTHAININDAHSNGQMFSQDINTTTTSSDNKAEYKVDKTD